MFLDAVLGAGAQLIERPTVPGHADHRQIELATLRHGLQRREDLFVRQIAGRPEEHQCVGVDVGHVRGVLV